MISKTSNNNILNKQVYSNTRKIETPKRCPPLGNGHHLSVFDTPMAIIWH